jgi:hypothetical protein
MLLSTSSLPLSSLHPYNDSLTDQLVNHAPQTLILIHHLASRE